MNKQVRKSVIGALKGALIRESDGTIDDFAMSKETHQRLNNN